MVGQSLLVLAFLAMAMKVSFSADPKQEVFGVFILNERSLNPRPESGNLGDRLQLKMMLETTDSLPFQAKRAQPAQRTTELDLDLKKDSAWTASSKMVVRRGGHLEEQMVNLDTNCYYRGKITNDASSVVSLNLCHPVSGSVVVGGKEFDLQETGGEDRKDAVRFKMTEMPEDEEEADEGALYDDQDIDTLPSEDEEHVSSRDYQVRNGAMDNNITIPTAEMAVFMDQYYIKELDKKWGINTTEGQFKFMIERYNKIRAFYLGIPFPIDIQLKYIEVWQEDPDFYNLTYFKENTLGKVLGPFCKAQYQPESDLKVVYTAVRFKINNIIGLSWVKTVCLVNIDCIAIITRDNSKYTGDVHEIGHQFGLGHESHKSMKHCDDDPGPKGFMGGGGLVWRDCYRETLRENLTPEKKPCLFEENLPALPILNTTPDLDAPPVG